MTEHTHYDFSPSNFRKRELCPGSCRMEKNLPSFREEPNPEAERIRNLIDSELVLIYGFELAGELPETDYESAEDAECIKKMIRKLYGIIGDRTILGGSLKSTVSYSYLGKKLFEGRPDLILLGTNRVIVVNWQVSWQLNTAGAERLRAAAYALGAMQTFDRPTVEVHSYNPWLEQYSSEVFDDQHALLAELSGIISACGQEDAPLVPGREQCRYCRAAAHGTCPAFLKTAELVAAEAGELEACPSLSHLPEQELCRLYHSCKMIEKLMNRIESRIRTVCEEKGQCGNLALKQISGGREIKDINAAFDKVDGVLSSTEFLTFCTVSASQLEKGYARKLKSAGKTKTEKEAKAIFSEIMHDLVQDKPPRKMLTEII